MPEQHTYNPRGAALALMSCRATEVLLSGPAGTGKSRACLEKLHLCAERVPGFRGLIVRKTRESLTEAGLVTLERDVIPPGHPALAAGGQRRMRQSYQYANGSQLVVGGLDKPEKVLSTEYDAAYVQEATELSEDAWEVLSTRLRNNVLPFQQLLADTNPAAPTHWLYRRCQAGKTAMLHSRHEDNPRLWDAGANAWTEEGKAYLAKLDALTGARYHRLRHGRWVQAEGAVYDGWDAALHLIDSRPVPQDWPRYWSVDFGYTNPFVCQFWAQDPDRRLVLYRELYFSGKLVEDHARDILDLVAPAQAGKRFWREPRPRAIVCDHDAEGRATLERHLELRTTPAFKAISSGIQAVAARLKRAGDGRPRLHLMAGALVRRDPALDEAKRPGCTAEEFDSYTWDLSNNRAHGEEPVDADNHGMDALRYMVTHLDVRGGGNPGRPRFPGGGQQLPVSPVVPQW
jgi:phage terminase large subunit